MCMFFGLFVNALMGSIVYRFHTETLIYTQVS
jgi:hypothetical protein